jgi:hypothetical protein
MVKLLIFNTLLFGSCGYALWKGGAPERIGAGIFLIATVLTVIAASGPATRFSSVELGILIVDLAMLVALSILAVRAERFWPLWVTAFQLVATAGHALRFADPTVIPRAYAFILAFWSYPMLLILVLGTYRHQQRLAKFGVDRSWSSSWGRSGRQPKAGPTD